MSASLIKRFGQKITVKRDKNPEMTIKGKRVDDVYEDFIITASVQPIRPDEIVEDSVGAERNRQAIRLYSFDELRVNNEKLKLKADIVVYQGENYEVRQVDKWVDNKMKLVHYKSVAFLINKELK